jgi:ribosome recycling factor
MTNIESDPEIRPGTPPSNDGKVVRIPIPALTEERRHELVKHVKKIAEEFRVSVRNHRRLPEKLKESRKERNHRGRFEVRPDRSKS